MPTSPLIQEHVTGFFSSFIAKRYQRKAPPEISKQQQQRAKRERELGINWMKGMDNLYRELDLRYCNLLPKGSLQQNMAYVHQALAKYRLSQCYVLSSDDTLHEQTLGIDEALEAIVGQSNTTIISFLPGKLAYFEGHSIGERYLCIREA